MRDRMGGMKDDEERRELQRIEYEGFLLIEYELSSALSYGPRTYKRWDIFQIEAEGSHKYIGGESYEKDAKWVADYLNGKTIWGPPPTDGLK
jgi:hypothetical protein